MPHIHAVVWMRDRPRRIGAEEISYDQIAVAGTTDRVSNNGVTLKAVDYQPAHRAVTRIEEKTDGIARLGTIEFDL